MELIPIINNMAINSKMTGRAMINMETITKVVINTQATTRINTALTHQKVLTQMIRTRIIMIQITMQNRTTNKITTTMITETRTTTTRTTTRQADKKAMTTTITINMIIMASMIIMIRTTITKATIRQAIMRMSMSSIRTNKAPHKPHQKMIHWHILMVFERGLRQLII